MSIKCMTAVWEIEGVLTASQKLVLLCLADHANDDGVCWPSMPRLAQRSDMKLRNTQRVVHSLIEKGYVEVLEEGGGRGKTTVYRIKPDGVKGDIQGVNGVNLTSFSEDTKGVISDTKGVISDTKGVIQGQKGVIASHTRDEPPIEPTTEPSDKPQQQQPGRGRRLADGELEGVVKAWKAAGDPPWPASAATVTHLRQWCVEYGADEVLASIDIASKAAPATPERYVEGVLGHRRRDREREAEMAEVFFAGGAPPKRKAKIGAPAAGDGESSRKEENLPGSGDGAEVMRALRQIESLRTETMTVQPAENGGPLLVHVTHPSPSWAALRLQKTVDRTLRSAGLEAEVKFVQEEW